MQSTDSLYSLQIKPNGRTVADEYLHQNNIWIEGREGSRFEVIISNKSSSRALFIVAIDGLDVIEGKPAGIKSQGYVVDATSTISIPGWKLNNQEAAEFFFSRKSESYVNAIGGNTANTGVIGAMIFREKNYLNDQFRALQSVYTFYNPYGVISAGLQSLQSEMIGINSVQSVASQNCVYGVNGPQGPIDSLSQDVATGFGEATNFNTSQTVFVREDENNPTTTLVMYYNTAKNLQKMGIQLRSKNNVRYSPNPFPATYGSGCIPPKDWVK